VWGAWWLFAKACFSVDKLLLELLAAGDWSALCRGNCADTTLQGTDAKVSITFFSCDALDGTLDANLSLEVVPVKT
jgi:hypothetical protein